MRTLIFDTETTGLANHKKPISTQPYTVQLAATLMLDDKVVGEFNTIVIPSFKGDVMAIPPRSTETHGITDAMVEVVGMRPEVVVPVFNNLLKMADRLVAHNMKFDLLIMKALYSRLAADQKILWEIPKICTMLSSKPILKLPGKYGDYKWPSLEEAYAFLVNPDGFEDAHNAAADVMACRAVLKALEERGAKLTP